MAPARQVFADLTNNAEDVLPFRSKDNFKTGDALKPEALSSPKVYTTDARTLEGTPYQTRAEKLGNSGFIDIANVPNSPDLPSFDTPPKVQSSQLAKAPHQDVDKDCHRGAFNDPCHDLSKAEDSVPDQVANCAAELLDLWEFSARTDAESHRIGCMLQKFGALGPQHLNFLRAAFYHPPQMSPPAHVGVWPQPKRSHGAEQSGFDQAEGKRPLCQDDLPTVKTTLERLRSLSGDFVEYAADAALGDLVHKIMRSCHLQSERCIPDAKAVLKNLPAKEREQALQWLFQVAAGVNFQDSVLHLSVLLLDRYVATLSHPVPLEHLQLVIVAVLSIALKMNGAVDPNSRPPRLQDVLVHIVQNRFSIHQIFSTEHDVLRALGFAVSQPTAADLLDTFLIPHKPAHQPASQQSPMSSPVQCMAQFLLQLSLLDAPLHYRYSQSVLAAGALYVALWCTQHGQKHVLALLDDVAACFNKHVADPTF